MIKILHVVEAFAGGVLTYLQALVNGLDEQYQAYILYARRPDTPKETVPLFKAGTVLIESENLTRSLNLYKDLLAFIEVRKVASQVEPDIVHLHSSKAGVIGRWALNGKKTPLFYTPNGYSFLMDNCSKIKKSFFFILEKMSGYRACTTIACGKGEYEYGTKVTSKIQCIYNGIDVHALDHLLIGEGMVRSHDLTICITARITRQKNPKLFNDIAERIPEIKFIWIGDGECRELLTSPNIEIIGWLPKEDALTKMMTADVFLLPSLWEGFSLSLIEAMYLKRLCIVSNIPGNVDAIINENTGYVCASIDDYIDVISRIQNSGIDQCMLNAAHNLVKESFTQEKMVASYIAAYEEALKKSSLPTARRTK